MALLMPLVYAEMHGIARQKLSRERPDHTLQPTALVNEVYLKLFEHAPPAFADRAHFLAFASVAMRRILVDYARGRRAVKRGGEVHRDFTLEVGVDGDSAKSLTDLIGLHVALEELAEEDPESARAVEMRYFGGMTAEETASVTGHTIHVVQHQLRFAHAWLRRRMAGVHRTAGTGKSSPNL